MRCCVRQGPASTGAPAGCWSRGSASTSGNVRVHTDRRAAASAQAMNAKAYTVGSDEMFASGQYSPRSLVGQKLLAHELAHSIQQAGHSLADVESLSLSTYAKPEQGAEHIA